MNSLSIPVKKLSVNAPDSAMKNSSLGSFYFGNRTEREALTQMLLPSLLKANAIRSTGIYAKVIEPLRLASQTNQQKLLKIQTVEKHNTDQMAQAIDANKTELTQLNQKLEKESSPTSIEYLRIVDRLEHLQQENRKLQEFGKSLKPNQHLLGFAGDSESALIRIAGERFTSFGSHSFAIVQDTSTGNIQLTPIETDKLNSTIVSEDKDNVKDSQLNTALSHLFRKQMIVKHKSNSELREKEEKNMPKEAHFFEKLFGTKQTQTTGAESAGAACCSITSLDELANVGQRTDHDHGEIITPKTSGEAALTGFVTYASAAGIKIAGDIYANFNAITKEIKIAEQTLALVKIENKEALNVDTEKKRAVEACQVFLNRQKSEANFQKRVAGILSGFGSLSILVGQFVAKVSPVGLYLLSAFGAGHVLHMGKQLRQACKDYKTSQPETADQHHFFKKIKNLSLALISWSFYTAGTATLGTMSLGMMGITLKTGLAPALTIAGIASLGIGIAGSVVYNNIVSSKRFYPGAPMLARLDVRNPPTEKDIDKNLTQAQALRSISKDYRATTFQAQRKSNPFAIAKHHSLRYLNKVGLYSTLGLYPAPFMNNKFKIKEQRTQAINHTNMLQNSARFKALSSLFAMEKIANPSLAKVGTLAFQPAQFEAAKNALSADRVSSTPPNRKENIQSLHQLLDLFDSMPKSDQILKVFAKKVLTEDTAIKMKAGSIKQNGVIGQLIPEVKTTTWLKPEYTAFFEDEASTSTKAGINKNDIKSYDTLASDGTKILSTQNLDTESLSALGALYKTKPCCGAHGSATGPHQGLTYFIRENYTNESHQDQATIQKLQDTLYECIDQYLLYQARNNAKEDIALYANYKKAFNT